MSEQLNQQKNNLRVMQIQLETLASLEPVKSFLEIREKAELLASIIKSAEEPSQDV